MEFATISWRMVQVLSAFVLLVVFLLIVTEIGFRAGVRSKKSENDEVAEPEKVAATFVLSLLSLILAFTLSSAQSHHNARAEMILREAQSIRSARLALEDLPEGIRDEAMIQLNRYVKSKKSYNDILHRMESPEAEFQEGRRILHEIRRLCRAAIDPDKPESGRESLERIDHVAEVGLERHVLVIARHGDVVIRFLLVISTVACFLLGHAHRHVKRRIWWAGLLFASVISGTIALIFDYDSPRAGLIRVDASDVLYDELSQD